jgi:hypothetical protein
LVAGIACCSAALALMATAGAGARDGSFSRIKIETWPHGLFGYVTSPTPGRCADHRRVALFKQRGKGQHPRRDKRIARVRTRPNHRLHQWSVRTNRKGRFYAKARRTPGCRVAFSKSIHYVPETGTDPGDGGADYPPCSPYVSEGGTSICKFTLLRFGLESKCPSFSSTKGTCEGITDEGLFPWGTAADGNPNVQIGFDWNWDDHGVLFFAKRPGQSQGVAHLGGTMPGPGSANFTITDGFAQNDQGYPNGDHFYTPDLPGQAAGEIGGPLNLFFDYHSGGSNVKIRGYLYLKG